MKTAALALACAAGLITLSGCDLFSRDNGGNGQQSNTTPQAPGPLAPKPDANGVGAAAPAAAGPGGKPTPGAAPAATGPAMAPATGPAPAAAANPTAEVSNAAEFRQLVSNYLDNYAGQLASGYQRTPSLSDQVVPLQQGQTWNWAVQLQPGQTYRIIGGCDNECTDFDLAITDPQGNTLDSDYALDDYPVLDFTASAAGWYQVQMTMATCSVAPCYAGARVFQR